MKGGVRRSGGCTHRQGDLTVANGVAISVPPGRQPVYCVSSVPAGTVQQMRKVENE